MTSLKLSMGKLLVALLLIAFCSACKENTELGVNQSLNLPRINLFPQETEENVNREMTLEQAIAYSDKVVLSNQITLIDVSTKERSPKVFYLYKAHNTKTIKEDPKKSTATLTITADTISSFYFYSDEMLHFNLQMKDSMYLFLQSNREKKILTEKYNIAYKWLENGVIIPK